MWGGRFAAEPSKLLRALNDSFAFDRELFAEDVQGSIAWARAIGDCGVLTAEEVETIVNALANVAPPSTATLSDFEDVHSYVEAKLYEKVGKLAGKLHTGRSRNDQVATDLKLWLKKACADAIAHVEMLRATLEKRAEPETIMPGYTHSKQAEPVTFAMWCGAYIEMLARDAARFDDAIERGDECPLGSGALAGSPLPVNREKLAKSLGFARATRNSLDAVSDRDFAAEYLFAATLLLSHLSRLAEDLIFYTSDEAAYAELPDTMATGSSRMPQKKNPDVLELTRGHAGRAIGELTGLLAVLKGLPLAYDKDLQLDKEPLFRIRIVIALVVPAIAAIIDGLQLNREKMRAAASSDLLVATSYADKLAATGIPFREAHEIVGNAIRNGTLEELAASLRRSEPAPRGEESPSDMRNGSFAASAAQDDKASLK
jgi:argininosuccinate lyase/amino-acid N-acetyltransferase